LQSIRKITRLIKNYKLFSDGATMSKTIPLFDGIDTIIIRVKDVAKSKSGTRINLDLKLFGRTQN